MFKLKISFAEPPTITSDWGAFAENNINGVTGYRCRTFEDYINAALNCLEGTIRYEDCYNKGQEFILENVAPRYEKFFTDVYNIYRDNGWYALSAETMDRINRWQQR